MEESKADKGRGGKTTSGEWTGLKFGKCPRGTQRRLEKTGGKVICGAPTTLKVEELMTVMMIMRMMIMMVIYISLLNRM